MLFRTSKTLKDKNYPKENLEERRKIRSIFQGILPSTYTQFIQSGRASVFTFAKGSITVEASLAVPLFFFAVVCLLYLMEMMAIQTSIRAGLQYAGKIAAQEGYLLKTISVSNIEKDVVNGIGADRLERSIVEGGSSGIDCSGSFVLPAAGIGELSARYEIRIPVPVFHIGSIPCEEKIRMKMWCGYEKSAFGITDEKVVYITETGVVYHEDYHCTHLELSVRMVPKEQVEELRNKGGGKYHACHRCGGTGAGGVYVTLTGDRYHSSISCSGLKRTIYAVPVSEAAGKRACAKCGR